MKSKFTIAALTLTIAATAFLPKANAQWKTTGNTLTANAKLGTLNGYPLQLYTNGTERMRIDLSGNIGIGTTTPFYKLDVSGNINMGSTLYQNGARAFATNAGLLSTITGVSAGYNATGNANSIYGYLSGTNTTTGAGNSFFGYITGNLNKTGSGNSYFGSVAGDFNSAGDYNTCVGYASAEGGSGTVQYHNNSLIGAFSGQFLTTGSNNSANGYQAMYSTGSGNNNTAAGFQSMYSNVAGYSNVAIGTGSLYSNKNAGNLVAIGDSALYNSNNSVTGNTAVGSKALYTTTTGYQNTGNGYHALYQNTTGSYNTAFGGNALSANTTGSFNTAVGYNAYPTTGTVTNYTGIGYNVGNSASASNMVELGNAFVTVIRGQVNFSTYSDARIKNDIKNNVPGLAFINLLKPATYKIDLAKEAAIIYKDEKAKTADGNGDYAQKRDIEKELKTGFLAQEVEAAAKKLDYDFSGVVKPQNEHDLYSLRYSEFVVPLVKAVQELSKMNDDKEAKIENLQQQIDELKAVMPKSTTASAVSGAKTSAALTGASLEQNNPNPFSGTATIRYTLPQQYAAAQIVITDPSGKMIKQIALSGNGKGSVNVEASTLAAGIYHYSLYVNGSVIATKEMAIAK